jgi:catechol 2,3-dioxygenase-like lactoylglutathione lyase family enzyme
MSIQLQKLDYVIVYVSNMQRSTNFYRDVLGLPQQQTSGITLAVLHDPDGQGITLQQH